MSRRTASWATATQCCSDRPSVPEARVQYVAVARTSCSSVVDSDAGARPLILLAGLPDPQRVNGQYFDQLKPNARTSQQAQDVALATRLWETTAEMLSLPTMS